MAVVESSNTILRAHTVLEHTDVTVKMNNEALNDFCRGTLDIERLTHQSA